MANYRKSFNFRSGVQVDNDSFIVDQRGNVGIGTSIPNRFLDVYGTARVNSNLETETLNVTGVSTFSSIIGVGDTIFLDPVSGIISAVSYRGDGSLLANVIAIATNGWVVANQGLSTSLNVYIGPSENNILPTPLGRLHVGTGSSIFVVKNEGGRVGLGTTIPSARLDVRGDTSLVGVLTVSEQTNTKTLQVNETTYFRGNINGSDGTYQRLAWSPNTGALSIGNTVQGAAADFTIYGQGYGAAVTLKATGDVRVSGISTFEDRIEPKSIQIDKVTDLFSLNDGFADVDNTICVGDDLVLMHLNDGRFTRMNWIGCDEYPLVFGTKGETGLNYNYSQLLRIEPGNDESPTNTSYVQLRHGTSYTTNEGTLTTIGTGVSITGEVFANRLDINGQSELHHVNSTGIITATRFVGNVTGIASEAIVLSNAANITTGTISDDRLPSLITSNINTIAGISTVNKLRSANIGIGTNIINYDFVINKPTSVVAEFISTQGSITLSLGSQEVTNNNTSSLVYTPTSETLELRNYGSGGITFHTHKGTGDLIGIQTGGFFFKSGSAEVTLAHLAADGRFAINQEVSEDSELDFTLVSNGNVNIKGNLFVNNNLDVSTGIATIQDLVLINPAVLSENQNLNTVAGISTFNEVQIAQRLDVVNDLSVSGVSTFVDSVFIGSPSTSGGQVVTSFRDFQFFGANIGLSSTRILFDSTNEYGSYSAGVEALTDPRNPELVSEYFLDPTKTILPFAYGDIQLRTGGMSIITRDYINIHPSIANSTDGNWPGLTEAENLGMGLEYAVQGNLCMVGINTIFTRSIFDLGHAIPQMNSYFIPPRLGTVGINTVRQLWDPNVASNWANHTRAYLSTPDGLVSGGILFDVDKNQLQVAVGSTTFCGVATLTNNHSGYESFVPPKVTNSQRTTLTNAGIPEGSVVYNTETDTLQQYDGTNWSSLVKQTGIGTQATISVVGSKIIFSVAGIGSTSLTLV